MIKFWNFEAIRRQLTALRLVNKSKNVKNWGKKLMNILKTSG